ncbi:MAG: hypothetical protein U0031_15005 [Thermomicrobiales bacterium]
MDAKLRIEAENLRRTAERFSRAGLIVDFACLSREHRRAAFALQCTIIAGPQPPQPKPAPIGFAYPNAR